ncbi:MAG TPA: hypothetical protein VEV44_07675 [Pseudoneobacillus sp.]|nr:hypothetical protein [Pseudoneobacillus sp.]
MKNEGKNKQEENLNQVLISKANEEEYEISSTGYGLVSEVEEKSDSKTMQGTNPSYDGL